MAYSAEISRTSPTCFLFVIDQSGSMADPFGGEPGVTKARRLADATNRLLQELVLRCAKEEGVRDYFHVGVIGYGATVGPAFVGPLAGKELVPISQVADNPVRLDEKVKKVDDGAGGLVDQTIRLPIWLDPVANDGTPMCTAFRMVRTIISGWVSQHPDGFPPVVLHVTDGEATDGDPTSELRGVTDLSSSDGNVILFNINVSSRAAKPISFPSTSDGLPDQYATMLFDTASLLTPAMRTIAAKEYQLEVGDNSRAMVFNADSGLVIMALDIGTRPGNLR